MRKHFAYWVFIPWIAVWGYGAYQDFQHSLPEFKYLMGKSVEDKWEHLMGEELYTFMKQADEHIPKESPIIFEHGLSGLHYQRVAYYLYPRVISEEGHFLLHFKKRSNHYYIKRLF